MIVFLYQNNELEELNNAINFICGGFFIASDTFHVAYFHLTHCQKKID